MKLITIILAGILLASCAHAPARAQLDPEELQACKDDCLANFQGQDQLECVHSCAKDDPEPQDPTPAQAREACLRGCNIHMTECLIDRNPGDCSQDMDVCLQQADCRRQDAVAPVAVSVDAAGPADGGGGGGGCITDCNDQLDKCLDKAKTEAQNSACIDAMMVCLQQGSCRQ